jgi:prevent-host-death family protein
VLIKTENKEMRSMRSVSRELAGLVAELQTGGLEKVVVTKHGRMVAVLLTVDEYERLADGDS